MPPMSRLDERSERLEKSIDDDVSLMRRSLFLKDFFVNNVRNSGFLYEKRFAPSLKWSNGSVIEITRYNMDNLIDSCITIRAEKSIGNYWINCKYWRGLYGGGKHSIDIGTGTGSISDEVIDFIVSSIKQNQAAGGDWGAKGVSDDGPSFRANA